MEQLIQLMMPRGLLNASTSVGDTDRHGSNLWCYVPYRYVPIYCCGNDMIQPIDAILSRLNTRETGKGRWQAKCPSHKDSLPSLSIIEYPDSSCSVKCWAGCDTKQIMESIGLEVQDLFPEQRRFKRKGISFGSLSESLQVIAVGLADMAKGKTLDHDRLNRLVWEWLDDYSEYKSKDKSYR